MPNMPSGPKFGFYYAIAAVPLMIAGVVAPDVFHLSPQRKEVTFFLCMAAAFVCVFIGARKEYKAESGNIRNLGHRRRMIAIYGMFFCGLGFIGFASAYFWPGGEPEQTERDKPDTKAAELTNNIISQAPQKQADQTQGLTIKRLWETDFNVGSYKMLQDFETDLYTTDAKRLGRFDFGVGIYGSFDSKSVFMSLYVPGSAYGYELIKWLADGYRSYLDDATKNIRIWAAPKGDNSQPISENLVFTNRIFIYHENIFTDAKVNELNTLYRSKGLDPVFRGLGYLDYKRLKIDAGQETMPIEPSLQSLPPLGFNLPPIELSPQYIDGQKLPSLLSLFMTDFKGVGGMAANWIDFKMSDGSRELKQRVQVRIYNDIHNHKRFISFYIPPSSVSFSIIEYLASAYSAHMNELTTKVASAEASPSVSKGAAKGFSKNYNFSGIVYIYNDNSSPEAQIERLKKLYKDHGADVEFRDFSYVIETCNKIKSGNATMPQEYRLTDEFPEPVSNGK
jgi:hypothetical protein